MLVHARRLLVLLAALTALALVSVSSALATGGPQTRVRAYTPQTPALTGEMTLESSCTRPVSVVASTGIASGFCVATEEESGGNAYENPNRNPAQDKPLTPRDIQTLQDNGYDLHGGEKIGGSSSDLYKDADGNVYEKPKGGAGPGEPIGANLNSLRGQ